MRIPQEAYRSRVYLNFKEIGSREYQTIVRFFEQYEDDIRQLTFEEYFEMLLAYMDALFECGAYSNFIDCCDYAIESVIYFNVDVLDGEDIYHKLLFRKAASYYRLMEYEKCEHILRELIRMNPEDQLAIQFLKKCRRTQPPIIVRNSRAVSVLLFLISAGIIALELIVVKQFFPEYANLTESIRNTTFSLGWVVLIAGGSYLRYRVSEDVKGDLRQIKNKKQLKNVERNR